MFDDPLSTTADCIANIMRRYDSLHSHRHQERGADREIDSHGRAVHNSCDKGAEDINTHVTLEAVKHDQHTCGIGIFEPRSTSAPKLGARHRYMFASPRCFGAQVNSTHTAPTRKSIDLGCGERLHRWPTTVSKCARATTRLGPLVIALNT